MHVNNIRDVFCNLLYHHLHKAYKNNIGACNHVNSFVHSFYTTPILLHTFVIAFLLLVRYI